MLEEYVREGLRRARIVPSRARGQHFLVNDTVLAAILRAGQLDGSELVVEVGPGLGTLTQSLASRVWRVAAYELDDKLVGYLRNWVLPEATNIELHDTAFNKYAYERLLTQYGIPFVSPDADVMEGMELDIVGIDHQSGPDSMGPDAPRRSPNATPEEGRRPATPTGSPPVVKIITNLPYQISSAFLHFAVDYVDTYERIVVMLQKQVAERVIARSGEPGYNSFSLYLQTYLEGRWVCDVPADSFFPPPRVESAVLHLRPLRPDEQPQPRDRGLYLRLIQGVFKRRRKTLANAVQQAFSHLSADRIDAALGSVGIGAAQRAGELTMADYVRLADALSDL